MKIEGWKVKLNNKVLAQVLGFIHGIEQSKIVSKALDGTIHIQTIGAGTKHASVAIACTREECALIDKAEADGSLVNVTYRDKQYSGYIESALSWSAIIPGEWYKATFRLLILTEVDV